jgi:hypothetical protein
VKIVVSICSGWETRVFAPSPRKSIVGEAGQGLEAASGVSWPGNGPMDRRGSM